MTDFQELKLQEFNVILKLCFERKQLLKTICEHMPKKSESAVRKKIYQLKELEIITQDGCYYKSVAPKFPPQLFDDWIDEKHQRMSASMKNDENGRRVKFVANQSTLASPVYVHKMERLADKYKEQAKHARENYVRKTVHVGNVWSLMV